MYAEYPRCYKSSLFIFIRVTFWMVNRRNFIEMFFCRKVESYGENLIENST